MRNFFKQLLCFHDYSEFVRNIHGDEINVYGGKRSIWRCIKCKHTKAKGRLFDNSVVENQHAQSLQRTLEMVSALNADEQFEQMVAIANKVYAEFCLKELHLAKLEGRRIAQRGPMKYESIPQIETSMKVLESKIIDLSEKIKIHMEASQRILETAKRVGVVKNA